MVIDQGLGFRAVKEKGFTAKGSGFKSFRHWVWGSGILILDKSTLYKGLDLHQSYNNLGKGFICHLCAA